jgi:hypothetical protein
VFASISPAMAEAGPLWAWLWMSRQTMTKQSKGMGSKSSPTRRFSSKWVGCRWTTGSRSSAAASSSDPRESTWAAAARVEPSSPRDFDVSHNDFEEYEKGFPLRVPFELDRFELLARNHDSAASFSVCSAKASRRRDDAKTEERSRISAGDITPDFRAGLSRSITAILEMSSAVNR